MAHVMVVDDEDSIRRLLSAWLSSWGFDVRVAVDADDALEQMESDPASVMLCDVMMPVHDGVWLAEQIRRRWPRTAIIMATGDQALQTVETTRNLGAIDYVTKPFGRAMLQQALRRALDWNHQPSKGKPDS